MGDQICSPEKCSMKNSYNKSIFYLNEKNMTEWKYILMLWKKGWYNENIFYWIKICFDWIKIYFDIMEKKVIKWKYVLLNTKLFWLNENIFCYHEERVI